MKAQYDAARQKEVVIKACLQSWLDEAFAVSTTIDHKVVHMQTEYATMEPIETESDVSVTCVELIQRMMEEFAASTSKA